MKKQELIGLLLASSFLHSETPRFPLASGKLSRYYIDCRKVLSHARARELAGDLILEKLGGGLRVDAVGGLLVGAYPVAIAVSDAAARAGKAIAAFAVRKEPKGHGLKNFLEGDVEKGQRVLVVDDVVTSGQSTVQAIERCRAQGLEVVRAVALVDRQEENGRENVEKTGVGFEAVLTLADLLSAQGKGAS